MMTSLAQTPPARLRPQARFLHRDKTARRMSRRFVRLSSVDKPRSARLAHACSDGGLFAREVRMDEWRADHVGFIFVHAARARARKPGHEEEEEMFAQLVCPRLFLPLIS